MLYMFDRLNDDGDIMCILQPDKVFYQDHPWEGVTCYGGPKFLKGQ